MMAHRRFSCLFIAVLFAAVYVGDAVAESNQGKSIQFHLYAGQTAKAASIAETRLLAASDNDQARFEIGVVKFLQAVENLGQGLHRYGLRSSDQKEFGLIGLPILRIPVPENSDPDELTYESFRGLLATFIKDLHTAETTLGKIKTHQNLNLPMHIGLIRLDINGDGKASEDESLWHILSVVIGNGAPISTGGPLTDFDGSDVAWLQAYCHLLMAVAEFSLAHDWQKAFEVTFSGLFHMPSSPYGNLNQAVEEAIAKLGEWTGAEPKYPNRPADMSWGDYMNLPEYKEWKRHQEWLRANPHAQRKIDDLVLYRNLADLIAFVHLNHWPVIEPERMANVLAHLEAMIRLSRENWKRILAEDDNGNEWIPSPNQTGALGIPVTQEIVDGWKNFLTEFEDILKGDKLVPHWRFNKGINMRRIFLEPRTFDIVLLVQGSAALPYLEQGEVTTRRTWVQITDLFGGNFFRYFIWIN